MTEEKKGFKRTDVGLIPEDWELKKVGDFLEFKNGLNKAKEFFGDGTPIINYMDTFRYPGLKEENIQGKVTLTKDEIRRFNVQKGDVFFTRTSETVQEIGISAVLEEDIENGVFSGFILRGRPKNDSLSLKFKRYCFSSEVVRKQIVGSATYTTRALTNGRHLSKVFLPIPQTLAEQQAIATALSDVDELIRSLGWLIQKKEAIKKGTMQQLLTGNKRLPGFDGDWEMKDLGDILTYEQPPKYIVKSKIEDRAVGVPVLTANKSFVLGYTNEDFGIYSDTPVIVFDDFTVMSKYVEFDFKVKSSAIKLLKPKSQSINLRFVYELMQVLPFSTGDHKRYYISEYQNIEIDLPSKKEQDSIVEILSDMDEELQTLRCKREKMVRVKEGMMQELLTGRTRLVMNEASIHQMPQKRNPNYEDAVLISTIIHRFGSGDFKLNRFRYQKFVYLLKRQLQASTKDYMKKAAGPYNPKMRYQGGESVAVKEDYIEEITHKGFKCFTPGDKVDVPLGYFKKWHGVAPLQWLDQFQYSKRGDLELLTTVDMAIQDILKEGKIPDLHSVKELIRTTPEWKKKLEKPEFTDTGIQGGIKRLRGCFNLNF